MKRPGWETELEKFARNVLNRRLEWGAFDCVNGLGTQWVEIATGHAFPDALKGYKTINGALLRIRRYGGGGLMDAADKYLDSIGAEPVGVTRAQRGDIVAFEADPPMDVAIGICCGRLSLGLDTHYAEGRVVYLPTMAAVRAWRL